MIAKVSRKENEGNSPSDPLEYDKREPPDPKGSPALGQVIPFSNAFLRERDKPKPRERHEFNSEEDFVLHSLLFQRIHNQMIVDDVFTDEATPVPSAAAAATPRRDETLYNAWQAHATPIGYSKRIQKSNPLSDRDYVDVAGTRWKAPQRVCRKKIGKKRYVVEPESELNGYDFPDVPGPHQRINWDDPRGVERARRCYEDRRAFYDSLLKKNGKLGHDPEVTNIMVRRPPGADLICPIRTSKGVRNAGWLVALLKQPEGHGSYWEEPWPNGIVDPSAAGSNRLMNERAAEVMNCITHCEKFPEKAVDYITQCWFMAPIPEDRGYFEDTEVRPEDVYPADELISDEDEKLISTAANDSRYTRLARDEQLGVWLMHISRDGFDWFKPRMEDPYSPEEVWIGKDYPEEQEETEPVAVAEATEPQKAELLPTPIDGEYIPRDRYTVLAEDAGIMYTQESVLRRYKPSLKYRHGNDLGRLLLGGLDLEIQQATEVASTGERKQPKRERIESGVVGNTFHFFQPGSYRPVELHSEMAVEELAAIEEGLMKQLEVVWEAEVLAKRIRSRLRAGFAAYSGPVPEYNIQGLIDDQTVEIEVSHANKQEVVVRDRVELTRLPPDVDWLRCMQNRSKFLRRCQELRKTQEMAAYNKLIARSSDWAWRMQNLHIAERQRKKELPDLLAKEKSSLHKMGVRAFNRQKKIEEMKDQLAVWKADQRHTLLEERGALVRIAANSRKSKARELREKIEFKLQQREDAKQQEIKEINLYMKYIREFNRKRIPKEVAALHRLGKPTGLRYKTRAMRRTMVDIYRGMVSEFGKMLSSSSTTNESEWLIENGVHLHRMPRDPVPGPKSENLQDDRGFMLGDKFLVVVDNEVQMKQKIAKMEDGLVIKPAFYQAIENRYRPSAAQRFLKRRSKRAA